MENFSDNCTQTIKCDKVSRDHGSFFKYVDQMTHCAIHIHLALERTLYTVKQCWLF